MIPKVDWGKVDAITVVVGIFLAIAFILLAYLGFVIGAAFVANIGLPATLVGLVILAVAVYLGIWFAQKFFD